MSICPDTAPAIAPPVLRLAEAARPAESAMEVGHAGLRHRAAWNAYVHHHPSGSVFHTTAWMESVEDAFGHRTHLLGVWRDNRLAGILPLSEVRSRFGGVMLVSVPYAVEGGPLADDEHALDALWTEARELGTDIGARVIDLRSRNALVPDLQRVEGYLSFVRELPNKPEDVLGWLPRKARAAARNAQNKFGLTAHFSPHYLRDVWRLYAQSMRRLGSLSYPYAFFEGLLERMGDDAHVQVVLHQGELVGGLLSFRFGNAFLPYFVGCDPRAKRLSVSNFVYLTAMERAVELGCTIFDFGRTRADNTGVCSFKRFHGFEPKPLGYQRYVFPGKQAANLRASNPRFQLARRIWPLMPLAVTVRLGAWVARHIPG